MSYFNALSATDAFAGPWFPIGFFNVLHFLLGDEWQAFESKPENLLLQPVSHCTLNELIEGCFIYVDLLRFSFTSLKQRVSNVQKC
jgi:hypothetical protein